VGCPMSLGPHKDGPARKRRIKTIKWCSKCEKYKDVSAFGKNRSRHDGFSTYCTSCDNGGLRKEQKARALRRWQRSEANVKKARLSKYGITQQDWDELAERQKHKCAICLRLRKLHVDHDHDTGKVRSLLCSQCNVGIGMFGEDPKVISRARLYLLKQGRYAA
jgi:hypothetical protein